MYYELYVDSLFLMNFVMNLYLLLLTNRSMFRTATRRRLILGAGIGALMGFFPYCFNGSPWLKLLLGIPPGSIVMIIVAFRVRSIKGFLEVLENMVKYSFLMGSAMLLLKRIPWFESGMMEIWGVLGTGALLYVSVGYLYERKKQNDDWCKVTLIQNENKLTVTALLDSGNSLIEPISGKPVAIIEKEIFACLFEKEDSLYRAIPYHSIGKKRGLLKGYLLNEIQIDVGGVSKICKDVYVAVCEEYISSEDNGKNHVEMILNPKLLQTDCSGNVTKNLKVRKERYG